MRNIKFRAKRTFIDEWAYGSPYITKEEEKAFIIDNCQTLYFTDEDSNFSGVVVNLKTIGQYTGLKDIDGNEIYEGDIVSWGMHSERSHEYYHRYAVVEIDPDIQFRILYYIDSQTKEKIETDDYTFRFGNFAYSDTESHLKVIGNIHDNHL